jgi:preprotein translocase subunit YajC
MKSEPEDQDNHGLGEDQIDALALELERLKLCVQNITSILEDAGAIDANSNVITKVRRQVDTAAVVTTAASKSEPKSKQVKRAPSKELTVGDKVRVLNKKDGNKGIIGTITRVTNSQVWIEPDDGGTAFRKWKENVKKLN